MTTQRIDIEILTRSQQSMKAFNNLQKRAQDFNQTMASATAQNGKFTRTLTEGLNRSSIELVRFNGNMLSTLFFGMELRRIFSGAIKSIFEGYKKIIPEGNEFNKQTTQLSANWQFFKFQLADALAQSTVFQVFIGFAINMVKIFQKIPAPIKTFIGVLLIVLGVIGAILMFTGIWALGVGSLINLFSVLKASIAKAGGAAKIFGSIMSPMLITILAVAAVLMALNASMGKFHDHSETGKKKWDKFKKTMVNVVGSALEPMLEAIGMIGINLGDMNEIMIVVGAVWQNVLTGIGMLINALIPIIRTVVNILTIFIRTIKNAAEMAMNFFQMDFKGVLDNWGQLKNGVVGDINDIVDAWKTSQKNFGEIQASFVTGQDIQAALDNYRQSLNAETQSKQGTSEQKTTGGVVVVNGMQDAVAQGLITQDQVNMINQLGFAPTGR